MMINMKFGEAKRILEDNSHGSEQFASAIAAHWLERQDHPGEVLASSFCWLYCWCTTSGPAKENAVDGARKAFGKIFRPIKDFEQLTEADQSRFREFAEICRNRVGDYEQELQDALNELFGPK